MNLLRTKIYEFHYPFARNVKLGIPKFAKISSLPYKKGKSYLTYGVSITFHLRIW